MQLHANAKLGLAGRRALVAAIEDGMTQKAAAAAFCVSPATAHRWWHRFADASVHERQSGRWAWDRSSRPVRSPRRLSLAEERPIIEARLKTGLGPGRLAWIVRRARSTIWKVLHRHGLSRYRREPAPPARRYEWSRPGALLHVDVAKLARFQRPGHKILGRSQATRKLKSEGAGHVCVHVAVDDNSRYAYVEQHPDELGTTTAAFLARAIDHFVALGCAPPDAVMTDNAFCYSRSRHFKALLARHHIRHITIPPYTPRWNGKAERFIQTLKREWAYAHTWANSTQRARALNSYLRTYNRHRPHSSLNDRPPISRIHNLRGQNS